MRRSAQDVIRNLQQRIAKLERQSGEEQELKDTVKKTSKAISTILNAIEDFDAYTSNSDLGSHLSTSVGQRSENNYSDASQCLADFQNLGDQLMQDLKKLK